MLRDARERVGIGRAGDGVGRRRRADETGVGRSAPQQRAIATERISEVLHSRRVDEVVDGAVGVKQQTNCRPGVESYNKTYLSKS